MGIAVQAFLNSYVLGCFSVCLWKGHRCLPCIQPPRSRGCRAPRRSTPKAAWLPTEIISLIYFLFSSCQQKVGLHAGVSNASQFAHALGWLGRALTKTGIPCLPTSISRVGTGGMYLLIWYYYIILHTPTKPSVLGTEISFLHPRQVLHHASRGLEPAFLTSHVVVESMVLGWAFPPVWSISNSADWGRWFGENGTASANSRGDIDLTGQCRAEKPFVPRAQTVVGISATVMEKVLTSKLYLTWESDVFITLVESNLEKSMI